MKDVINIRNGKLREKPSRYHIPQLQLSRGARDCKGEGTNHNTGEAKQYLREGFVATDGTQVSPE